MITASEALAEIGREHLNAATVAVMVCPRQHRLCRLIDCGSRGVVVMTEPRPPRPHSTMRRIVPDSEPRSREPRLYLIEPEQATVITASPVAPDAPTSCDCGHWGLPLDYLLEVVATPPPRPRGVPRVVINVARVERG